MTITVLIADDQPLMRAALGMSLSAEPDIDVIGEASDGAQALELAAQLKPDVIVMDIRMPRLDGVSATRQLTGMTNGWPYKVLIVTTFEIDDYVVDALRAGASGFLLKDATSAELVHAVRVIAAGDALLSPRVTRRLLDNYARRLPRLQGAHPDIPDTVTPREMAVLMLVTRGLSNVDIGHELHLAESSVKSHVSHLLTKLSQKDRVQLVIYAYEKGLIEPGGSVAQFEPPILDEADEFRALYRS